MSAGIVFHLLAAIAYAVLAVVLWRPLARGTAQVKAGHVTRIGLLAAIALHGIGLRQAIWLDAGLHLGWALALSAAIWLGMIVFWLESLFTRIEGLLLILLPVSAAVTVLAGAFPGGHMVAHAQSDWLRTHLLISLVAYGLTFIAALQALLMASLDKSLHHPVAETESRGILNRALDSLPPLLVQEHVLFRIISLGFFALTLAVVSGAFASIRLIGVLFPLDHKTIFTLLAWLTFAGLLIGRYARGWRGRVALRWTLVGFAFVLLAYSGSRFVLDVILQRG